MVAADPNAKKDMMALERDDPAKFKLGIRSSRIKPANEDPAIIGVQSAVQQIQLHRTEIGRLEQGLSFKYGLRKEQAALDLNWKQFRAFMKYTEGEDDENEIKEKWDSALRNPSVHKTDMNTPNVKVRICDLPKIVVRIGRDRTADLKANPLAINDHEDLTNAFNNHMQLNSVDLQSSIRDNFTDFDGNSFGRMDRAITDDSGALPSAASTESMLNKMIEKVPVPAEVAPSEPNAKDVVSSHGSTELPPPPPTLGFLNLMVACS